MDIKIDITRKNFDNKETHRLLEKHKERMIKKFPTVFEWLEVKPPEEIFMDAYSYFDSSGCLKWHPFTGFRVVVNTEYCLTLPDKGIWVADHELAHIGAICKYNDWTHRQRFKDICKFVRGKNCRACKYCR